jgi:hypothetical protein
MEQLIDKVGPYAGLAAFLGLGVLALLYFAQARDVRRLRENAEFLVEGPDEDAIGRSSADVPTAATVSSRAPEKAAREAAASAPNDAEAFRRAELARQAAERRQRFERRRTTDGRPGEGLTSRLPQGSSLVVIIIGGLLLLGGIAFAAQSLIGPDDSMPSGKGGKANAACPPSDTKVAVFNGTATSGLAGESAKLLRDRQFKVGPTTNSESEFDASVVMFAQGGQECAAAVSQVVGIPAQQPITAEIQGLAEGAKVAVVLGQDKAAGG